MTTTINAQATNGLLTTADGSGIVKLQSNGVTTNSLAWVNFNGSSGTNNNAYNLSSITRNGNYDYSINFTNVMTNGNYVFSACGTNTNNSSGTNYTGFYTTTSYMTTGYLRLIGLNIYNGGANQTSDGSQLLVTVAIFGN